jgi:hypothetical protein
MKTNDRLLDIEAAIIAAIKSDTWAGTRDRARTALFMLQAMVILQRKEAAAAPAVAPTLWEAFEMGFSLRSSMLGHVLTARDVGRLTTCDFWHEALQGMGEKTDLHAGLSFGEAIAKLKQEVKRRLDGLVAAPAPAVAPPDEEIEDATLSYEAERAVFNSLMRWHLVRMLQAWRYGGDLNEAGMAAFEWARTNNVGQDAFKASERAAKIAAPAPAEPKGEQQAIADKPQDAAVYQSIANNYTRDLNPEQQATNERDWHAEAWRVFGYRMLGSDNHDAIAKHLKAIYDALPGEGNISLIVGEQRAATLSEEQRDALRAAINVFDEMRGPYGNYQHGRALHALLAAHNGG